MFDNTNWGALLDAESCAQHSPNGNTMVKLNVERSDLDNKITQLTSNEVGIPFIGDARVLTRVPSECGKSRSSMAKNGVITSAVAKVCFEGKETCKKLIRSTKKDRKDVYDIEITNIRPSPYQPRKQFNMDALMELCNSIMQYGVLQPISVRKISKDNYELVAGERRLRASMMAGLERIPAILVSVSENDSAMLALIENVQRENLGYIEEAEAYQKLLSQTSMTQEQLAISIGKSQSTVANKLRLLRLSKSVRKEIIANDLTERHARALLKLKDEQQQLQILQDVCEKGLNVKKTEELVENVYAKRIHAEMEKQEIDRKVSKVVKDIRIFINTIKQAISMMKESGVNAKAAQFDRGEYLEFIIRIPKKQNSGEVIRKVS